MRVYCVKLCQADLLVTRAFVLRIAVNRVFFKEIIPFRSFRVCMKGKSFRTFLSRSVEVNLINTVQTTDNAQNFPSFYWMSDGRGK